MALQKSKTLPDGTTGSYWHIIDLHLNIPTRMATAIMGLWVDSGHYAAHPGAPLNYPKQVRFQFEVVDLATGITPGYVYTKILNYANSMIPQLGAPPGSPDVVADPDLAGATVVA